MARVNDYFLNVSDSYLFSTISKKVSAFVQANPDAALIRLGIGDVTRPLAPAVIDALHSSVDEMGKAESFKGYGPELGYEFLKERIIADDYTSRGVSLHSDEVIVGDGAKSDMGNIGDIFGQDNIVLIPDPVYPVYFDTNVMQGRKITLLPGNAGNKFLPEPPEAHADIIYLCSPNNPTGAVMDRALLARWVAYAKAHDAVILFDSAYERFISDPDLPHSIYEIEGAKECAIEFRSYSKTAGFTGLRCSYVVVPMELMGKSADGTAVSLNKMWNRRHSTKFNGTPYIVQKAAAAVHSTEGAKQAEADINYYMENARMIKSCLEGLGFTAYGGQNAPYIWVKCPEGLSSWEFFDLLLEKMCVVGTPGSGFGSEGEGYFRLTAFGTRENTQEALKRIEGYFKGKNNA